MIHIINLFNGRTEEFIVLKSLEGSVENFMYVRYSYDNWK